VTDPKQRVLLIDDEPLARRRLRQLISNAPDFDVVGECDDARNAVDLVGALRPDVVFLDIRMPHIDGFDVQAALREKVRYIVFVTAHPEHAARAFDVAASDYLVKPVTQARFNDALDRIRRAGATTGIERILLGGRLGGAAVAVADVVWLEAHGAYVLVHVGELRHVVRESLAQLLGRLGPRFLRIHRSAGINRAHVRALRRGARGLAVELSNGKRLPISRRKASEVVELLRQAPLPAHPQHEATGPDATG
jgi:two-component system, LytTR family, response regulator